MICLTASSPTIPRRSVLFLLGFRNLFVTPWLIFFLSKWRFDSLIDVFLGGLLLLLGDPPILLLLFLVNLLMQIPDFATYPTYLITIDFFYIAKLKVLGILRY